MRGENSVHTFPPKCSRTKVTKKKGTDRIGEVETSWKDCYESSVNGKRAGGKRNSKSR